MNDDNYYNDIDYCYDDKVDNYDINNTIDIDDDNQNDNLIDRK